MDTRVKNLKIIHGVMNLLTKEECEVALTDMYKRFQGDSYSYDRQFDILGKLIDEHFDNPPLKFEELKEGMWIWDNQLKWFFKVVICNVKVEGYESLKMFKVEKYEGGSTLMLYEPNRFYRKEVVKND